MTHCLNTGWQLHCSEHAVELSLDFPGDVHSALLAHSLIPDPYYRDTETSLDWVHEADWSAKRQFTVEDIAGHWSLRLRELDCCASVWLNGQLVADLSNQFIRHDVGLSDAVRTGINELEIRFHSNTRVAAERCAAAPFPVPYLSFNSRIPHTNFLRKTQCHAGWDWNIALMPFGVYGGVELIRSEALRLDECKIRQCFDGDDVELEVEVFVFGHGVSELALELEIDGQRVRSEHLIVPGENTLISAVTLRKPRRWWPVGYGEQTLYSLTVQIDGQRLQRKVGFREIALLTDKDDIGQRFTFAVNGREIFMRGANWIPADALPSRATDAVVEDLLQSAVDVNMNMIRVWGGGQYETDHFYDHCAKLGLLVWQDFMFACNIYPAYDHDWLASVRQEATQQVRRLSSHAAVALLCGDNELVGALGWFEETKADRDRYVANYDRLNHCLEQVVHAEQTDMAFWPSSPSAGPLNFSDGWHDDRAGDMHFWDVWHSSKDFEHYRTVSPRFCSEFGFQSFPSMRVIERFTEARDRNVSSPVMDVHQRNDGGNSRIVETIARYFRFPDGFADLVYMSQISQALAMKTAIEAWRCDKPRCMGTLYWQLNDTWPVASWASLEHGGGWKLVHYLARHFYAPVLVAAIPDADSGDICLQAVNDRAAALSVKLQVAAVDFEGERRELHTLDAEVGTQAAQLLIRIAPGELAEREFLYFRCFDNSGNLLGENHFLQARYKACELPEPVIRKSTGRDEEGEYIELNTDKPAFFVSLDLGGDAIFSDNGFCLLPGQPKKLRVQRRRHCDKSIEQLAESELQYLAGVPQS